jgi:hypothetical protein
MQILYWQDIPAQIKVWDDFEEIKLNFYQNSSQKSISLQKNRD